MLPLTLNCNFLLVGTTPASPSQLFKKLNHRRLELDTKIIVVIRLATGAI